MKYVHTHTHTHTYTHTYTHTHTHVHRHTHTHLISIRIHSPPVHANGDGAWSSSTVRFQPTLTSEGKTRVDKCCQFVGVVYKELLHRNTSCRKRVNNRCPYKHVCETDHYPLTRPSLFSFFSQLSGISASCMTNRLRACISCRLCWYLWVCGSSLLHEHTHTHTHTHTYFANSIGSALILCTSSISARFAKKSSPASCEEKGRK